MTGIQRPKVTFNILPATLEISVAPQKILLIGQMTSSGTATSGALVENILNDNSEDTLFGKTSMLANMVRAAKKINQVTQMDAIPLEDESGATAATGSIAFTGTATANGTIYISIGSDDHTYELVVENTDTADTIGGKLETLISGDDYSLVTGVNTTGSVALTAENKGSEGNNIGIKVSGAVAGVTCAVTAMSSGATDPDLSNLFDVIKDERYQTIIWPSVYDISTVTDLLDDRFNATNAVMDGVAVVTKTDTLANLLSAGNAQNSQSLVMCGNNSVSDTYYKGGAIFEMNNVISAQFGALRALRLTDKANISRYVIASGGALDSYGGAALASLPYFNTPFYDLPLIPVGKGFASTEIDQLAKAGVFTIGNNITRTNLILPDVVTTYKTDPAGNADVSYKYLNYVDTISTVREYIDKNCRKRFSQCRLTEGDLIAGRNIANEALIRAYITSLYQTLSQTDYVLTQAGKDALSFFKENLAVSLDMSTGTVTINMVTPIVTQLREILGTIKIAFSTQALQ